MLLWDTNIEKCALWQDKVHILSLYDEGYLHLQSEAKAQRFPLRHKMSNYARIYSDLLCERVWRPEKLRYSLSNRKGITKHALRLMLKNFALEVDKMLRCTRNFWFSSGLWKWLVYYISRMSNAVYYLKSEIWLLNTITSKSSFWIIDSWRRGGYVVQKHRYRITLLAE